MRGNAADEMTAMAERQPDGVALICRVDAQWRNFTYQDLDRVSDLAARGLASLGVGPGVKTVFLVRPGWEFFYLAFALFKVGATLVAVDPGIGPQKMATCINETRPQAFLGNGEAHWGRRLFSWGKKSLRTRVLIGKPSLLDRGLTDLETLLELGRVNTSWRPPNLSLLDPAAIVFTSGSTGPPKGVVYTHNMFKEQAKLIGRLYHVREGEKELITFPHFAFYTPSWGASSVIPEMDFVRPASADPATLAETILQHRVDGMFASPALLNRLGSWGELHQTKLPSMKRVVSAGAPVCNRAVRKIFDMMGPHGQVFTPYGATEALPVSSIEGREILGGTALETAKGKGVCVGLPVAGLKVNVIKLTDEPIETWSQELLLRPGQPGEIVVNGPVVSPGYFNRPEFDRLSKITGDGPTSHHRMGDLGYFDENGRLWFLGRKSQRIVCEEGVFFTGACEGVFNSHPLVSRTALIGVLIGGITRPALCVEMPEANATSEKKVRAELLALGAAHDCSQSVRDIFFLKSFPVDPRHNAKIRREELAKTIAKRLARNRS